MVAILGKFVHTLKKSLLKFAAASTFIDEVDILDCDDIDANKYTESSYYTRTKQDKIE